VVVALTVGSWLLVEYTELGASLPWVPEAAAVVGVLVMLGGMFWIYFRHRKLAKRSFGKPDDPAPALPAQFPEQKGQGRRDRQDRRQDWTTDDG
jgi:hypothetical protein